MGLSGGKSFLEVVTWVGVLCGLVVVIGVVFVYTRRWLFASDEGEPAVGWTLERLRALRDSGRLTIPEYEKLRDELARGLRGETGFDRRSGSSGAAE